MTAYNDYKKDMAIDPHCLEEEWMAQPALYFKYSQLLEQAQREKDTAKEALDVTKARLDLAIREDPDAYGLSKVTESTVASAILVSKEYRTALTESNEAYYRYTLLSNAIRALEHKKKALENMVSLWLGSYFAGPKEPKQIAGGKRVLTVKEVEQQQIMDKQKQNLQRRAIPQEEKPPARSRKRRKT